MNYADDGERVVVKVEFLLERSTICDMQTAEAYKNKYDEVYVIDFIPTQELINEVVLNGCRI